VVKIIVNYKGFNLGKRPRYTDEFEQEAVNQVVVHGYPVLEVSKRLGIANKSLYDRIKIFSKPPKQREEESDLRAEIALSKRELKRAEQDRAILKEAAVFFAGESKNETRS
jgi:transposase